MSYPYPLSNERLSKTEWVLYTRVYFKRCVQCSNAFVTTNCNATTCSHDCRSSRNLKAAIRSYQARSQRSYHERQCADCKTNFKPTYGNKRRRFCSDRCLIRHHARIGKHLRDERVQANGFERFDPIEVLERDGWTCQICGTATPQALRGTIEPSAPELDHIKPIAKGGAHTRANTQCACRSCNIAKADGGLLRSLEGSKPWTAHAPTRPFFFVPGNPECSPSAPASIGRGVSFREPVHGPA